MLPCRRYSQQAYYVRATNKRAQLLEVLAAFEVPVDEDSLLSRCARCNGTFHPRCCGCPCFVPPAVAGVL